MLSFEKSPNGYYIVRTNDGREYAWEHIDDNKFHDMTTSGYTVEIIHNYLRMAMINVVDTNANNVVLRQEVNPLAQVNANEWVVDNQ